MYAERRSLVAREEQSTNTMKAVGVTLAAFGVTCLVALGVVALVDSQSATASLYATPVSGQAAQVGTATGAATAAAGPNVVQYTAAAPTASNNGALAFVGGALFAVAGAIAALLYRGATPKAPAVRVGPVQKMYERIQWNPDGPNRQWAMLGVSSVVAGIETDTKAAISGFGRIGRNVLRCWYSRDKKPFDIVAINAGSMSPEQAAHLLKYDSVLGTFAADVGFGEDFITVDGKQIKLVATRDPATAPWKELGVEVIIEGTGAFNSLSGSSKHLEAGAKKVVITAPGKECPTYVCGVNEEKYDPATEHVVSNASCTTNGMASVCKVLDEEFGIKYGTMTTTHSYTGDQMILDGRHSDLRRARAGAMNIVPTSTGAAKAVALVLPSLKGKLNGIALRVPTPNVSIVDLVVATEKKTTKEEVNAALKKAAEGPLAGVLGYTEAPLVSTDFMGTNQSSTVDGQLSMVMGDDMVKVVMWYDNEWGYSQRVVDLTAIVASKL